MKEVCKEQEIQINKPSTKQCCLEQQTEIHARYEKREYLILVLLHEMIKN